MIRPTPIPTSNGSDVSAQQGYRRTTFGYGGACNAYLSCALQYAVSSFTQQPRHCTYPSIVRDSAKGVLRGLRVLFTGDSQMRNTWVTLAHLLGLTFPSSDHEHDVHSKTLGDGGFCAHDDEYDFHLCWRTNYALNRAVVLSKALATFHVVYFNPATHWRAGTAAVGARRPQEVTQCPCVACASSW